MGMKLRWHARRGPKTRKAEQLALCGTAIPLITEKRYNVTCNRCLKILWRLEKCPDCGSRTVGGICQNHGCDPVESARWAQATQNLSPAQRSKALMEAESGSRQALRQPARCAGVAWPCV